MLLLVRNAIHQHLLSPTLHSYGRTQTLSNWTPISQTPLVWVKVMIDTQDVNWKTHFLPDGYTTHEPVAITSVEGFIWEKLKFEKSNLTKLVHLQVLLHICKNPRTKDSKRYKVRSQHHKAIQRLDNLIFKIMESMSPQH
ncbi:uncharacterized protein VP01_1057g4 [Puccinia sorghi]|uniref:Uncharacterized protein n=1 Tax=Puccinia sorghi TaxID=27349 RepID=A0A0L6VVD3_9BASI|nr:uncharacterized protein VP01_1057g4 [Puccinia sorghi]